MTDDPAKPPRFPYVAALLCAACVTAAAWTWMRYSYCWNATPHGLWRGIETGRSLGWPNGLYVNLRGKVVSCSSGDERVPQTPDNVAYLQIQTPGRLFPVDAEVPWAGSLPKRGEEIVLTGRVVFDFTIRPSTFGSGMDLDTTASRFTGASIAGLVVGAMGVFVFTVALRHWLGERR